MMFGNLTKVTCEMFASGPFDEDSWAEVHFEGGASLKRLRPCNRCMVTTVDYVTGTHRKSREPLTTLRYNLSTKHIYFLKIF